MYEMADIDGDGIVTDEELEMDEKMLRLQDMKSDMENEDKKEDAQQIEQLKHSLNRLMASLQLERGPAQAEASSVGKVPARVEANGSNGPSPLPRGVGAVAKRTDLYQLHASTPRTEQPRVSKANTPWMLIRQNSASSLSSPKRLFD